MRVSELLMLDYLAWRLRRPLRKVLPRRTYRINASTPFLTIYIPSDETLRNPEFVSYLAKRVAELNLSRRQVVEWVAHSLSDHRNRFVKPDGEVIRFPDIDDVFGDAPDFRWVSLFLSWAKRKPAQATQAKVIPRVRLLAMAMANEEAFASCGLHTYGGVGKRVRPFYSDPMNVTEYRPFKDAATLMHS